MVPTEEWQAWAWRNRRRFHRRSSTWCCSRRSRFWCLPANARPRFRRRRKPAANRRRSRMRARRRLGRIGEPMRCDGVAAHTDGGSIARWGAAVAVFPGYLTVSGFVLATTPCRNRFHEVFSICKLQSPFPWRLLGSLGVLTNQHTDANLQNPCRERYSLSSKPCAAVGLGSGLNPQHG